MGKEPKWYQGGRPVDPGLSRWERVREYLGYKAREAVEDHYDEDEEGPFAKAWSRLNGWASDDKDNSSRGGRGGGSAYDWCWTGDGSRKSGGGSKSSAYDWCWTRD